jgi:hypothetical protein
MVRSVNRKSVERYLFRKKVSARAHGPPQRSGVGLGGIAVPQQQVQLMGIEAQGALRAGFRPAPEAALRKPFLAEPESLPVVRQALEGVPPARAEDEERAAERIRRQCLTAECGQSIDAFAEIHWLNRYENPHLRGDLNHAR